MDPHSVFMGEVSLALGVDLSLNVEAERLQAPPLLVPVDSGTLSMGLPNIVVDD